jgi:hypothetical protein
MISSNLAEDGFLPSDSNHRRSFHDLARPYNASPLNHTGFPPPHPATNNYVYQSMVQSAAVPRSSTHLSPTKSAARRNSPPIVPPADVNGAAVLYRSVSADSAALPQSVGHHHLVQRLAQQNALIREAWEAERNYLEANRRRAEEVYQEERVIMEEVREAWENEKAAMLREMQVLKERIQRLEGENHTLKAVAAQSVQITGVVSPRDSLRAASVDTSNASAASAPTTGFGGHAGLPGQSQQPLDQQSLSRQPQALHSQARQPLSPQALAALARHSLSHPTGPQHSLSPRALGHLDLAQQPLSQQPPRHLQQAQQPVPHAVLPQSIYQQHPLPAEADPFTLPPGLDGASRRPHFAKPGSSRTSPTGQPESSPFLPLDPRMQPQTSHAKDFLNSSTDGSDSPVPVIDVQEVDPKLEGIPLKATALQKYTFGANESANGSPAVSPPAVTNQRPAEKPRPNAIKRLSSKEHTFQVLQAEESRRLTMHAGHTPNHSLSLFPTMSIAASSTGAPQDDETSGQVSISGPASASGQASAPALDAPAEASEETEWAAGKDLDHGKAKAGLIDGPDDGPNDDLDLGLPEEVMEPEDDVKLKGPLMIKNIPAQDEIFWDQVNKKLEPISQGRDALPTVMRAALDEEETAGPSSGLEALREVAPVGGDASHDPGAQAAGAEGEGGGRSKGVEAEIPLKLKSTTNFGAPFGMA